MNSQTGYSEESDGLQAKARELGSCITQLSSCIIFLEQKSREYKQLLENVRELWNQMVELRAMLDSTLRDEETDDPQVHAPGTHDGDAEFGITPAQAVRNLLDEIDSGWRESSETESVN